jgi:thiol-disulfide isomerase/thioredoxin
MALRLSFLVLLAAVGLAACSEAPSLGETIMATQLGKDVSGTTVATLEGQPISLSTALQTEPNKPLLVNVWATWCTPCITEMPTLAALGQEGHIQVIAIATDASATTVKTFLQQQKWGQGVEVWFDAQGVTTRSQLGATGLPVTLLLNPQGKVVYATMGGADWSSPAMRQKLSTALSQ